MLTQIKFRLTFKILNTLICFVNILFLKISNKNLTDLRFRPALCYLEIGNLEKMKQGTEKIKTSCSDDGSLSELYYYTSRFPSLMGQCIYFIVSIDV